MKKKIIAIIASSLGVVLVSALIAAGALMLIREEKVEETGNVLGVTWYSEDEKEFVIDTVDELMEFAALSDFYTFKKQTIKLGADLVLNEGDAKEWEKNAPANRWAPISKFAGTFDGQNHTISGLYAKSYEAPIALFAETTRNAKIQNLSLVNSYFESGGTSGVASFVAKGDGKLTGLYSDAIIVCKGKNSGGIAAVSKTDIKIIECQFAGQIKSTGRVIGGILGTQENGRASLQHCFYSGDLYTTQKFISWASTDGPEAGGLLGSVRGGCSVSVSDSYVSGTVGAEFLTYTGAVVGLVYSTSTSTTMENVYTTSVIPGRTPIGDGSKWAESGPIEMPSAYMKGTNAYKWTTLDYDNYWGVTEGSTPVLRRFAKDNSFMDFSGLDKAFDTSWYDPEGYSFTINNLKELYGFALLSQTINFAEKTVKLGADIAVNEGKAKDWYNGKNLPTNPWFTIGTNGIQFAGIFDGKGHSISGVYFKTNNNYAGIFGVTAQPSTIKNLKVTNTFIDTSGNKDLRYTGGVIGAAHGNVDTIYTDAIVKSDGYDCGGIIGYAVYDDTTFATIQTINNCQFDGLVTGDTLRRAGGIIGTATYGSGRLACRMLIKNCLNTGVIQSKVKNYDQINDGMRIGGIVGYEWGGMTITFEDCINVGTFDLVYKTYASAFVGRGSGTAMVTFKNCYATKESASFAGAPVAHGGFSGANTKGDVLVLDESRLSGMTAYQYTLLDFDKYWGAVKDSTPQLRSFGKNFLNTSKVKRMIDTSWYDETKTSFTLNTREEFYGFYQVVLTDTMEGKTFKLGKDIDMNPGWVAGASEPEVLFFSINKFAGTFDGNNKVLKGIYIQDGAKDGVGLFHQLLEGGSIKNLILDNSVIQSNGSKATNAGWYTGGIVGNLLGGSISNIYVKDGVTVKSSMPYCGGIVGRWTGPATISEVWFDGRVEHDDYTSNMHQGRTGGIVGGASKVAENRVMNNCLMTGSVTGYSWNIGGIFGGTPSGDKELVKMTIKNCVTTGQVTSVRQNKYVGSILGGLDAPLTDITIENVYTTDDVKHAGSTYNTDNSYPGIGIIKTSTIHGATSKVTKAMLEGTKAYSSTALDFWSKTNATGVWVATDEGPELRRFTTSKTIVQNFDGVIRPNTDWYYKKQVNGKVPANTTFEIENEAEFFGFAKLVNLGVDSFKGHTVKLKKSLDLNPGWTASKELPKNGNVFTAIGSGVSSFEGTFDGGMKTIKGLYVYSEYTDNVGLFAKVESSALIKNLKLDNSYIESYGYTQTADDFNKAGWNVGAIVGLMKGSMDSCYTSSSVIVTSNKAAIGGLVGKFESSEGQIKNCLSESKVYGTYKKGDKWGGRYLGGLVGHVKQVPQDKAMIKNCMFNGAIYSSDFIAGGLIGRINTSGVKVEDSYSAGTIYAAHSGRLGVVAAWFETDTASASFENVYATTRLTDMTGTAVKQDRLDSVDGEPAKHILKGYNIIDPAQVVGKRAYTYTNLDFYWKGQNENAPWYATAEGPQLRKFATSTSIVDDFTGVFKPSTKWYEKKLNADGTIPENTTFEISTAGELYSFAQLVDSGVLFTGHTVKLTAKEYDFNPGWDASTMTAPTGEDAIIWNPIGSEQKHFQGTFDGNDAVIKGIYVYQDQMKGTGFFAYLGEGAKAHNFTLSNSFIKSTGKYDANTTEKIFGMMTGAVAGSTWGIIDSVLVDDSVYVRTDAYDTGGLTGRLDGSHGGYIQNSCFDGTIYLDNSVDAMSRIVGGLVGELWANPTDRAALKNCHYSGEIYAKNFMIGGLVGQVYCDAVFEDCLSNGEIYAQYGSRLSSFIGWVVNRGANKTKYHLTIKNVYGKCDIREYDGIKVRAEDDAKVNGAQDGSTTQYATKDGYFRLISDDQLYGTKAYKNTDLDFYWEGQNDDGVWVALTNKAPELMKFSTETNVIKNFANVIKPSTKWYTDKLVDGAIVPGTVFELETVGDLTKFSELVDSGITFEGTTVKLAKEDGIYDLNPGWDATTKQAPTGEESLIWNPIGAYKDNYDLSVKFDGVFDGNGATIRGIYVNQEADGVGFFSTIGKNGSIKNFRIENSYIGNTLWFTGAAVGRLYGNMDSVYVGSDVIVTSEKNVIGGLVGDFVCQPNGYMRKSWFAGVIITNPQRAGGLIGRINLAPALIENCLFTGTIIAQNNVMGGLIGEIGAAGAGTRIVSSLSNGVIHARYKTNLGTITGYGSEHVTVTNVYNSTELKEINAVGTIVGTRTESSVVSGVVPKSDEELRGDNAKNLTGFSFYSDSNPEGVWVTGENGPVLKPLTKTPVPVQNSEPQQTNLLTTVVKFLANLF